MPAVSTGFTALDLAKRVNFGHGVHDVRGGGGRCSVGVRIVGASASHKNDRGEDRRGGLRGQAARAAVHRFRHGALDFAVLMNDRTTNGRRVWSNPAIRFVKSEVWMARVQSKGAFYYSRCPGDVKAAATLVLTKTI